MPNRYETLIQGQKWNLFTSNIRFMGAPKRSPVIREMAEYLKLRTDNGHASTEADFFGYTSKWVNHEVMREKIRLVDGIQIGIKTLENKAVLLEDLLSSEPLRFCPKRTFGVFIPGDEILRRTWYQWFSVLSVKELLKTDLAITPYILASLADTVDENTVAPTDHYDERTVISI
jgi:hypothetical protein